MTVLIKDEEADTLIRELADITGQTITDAVKSAVREKLARLPRSADDIARRRRRIAEILAKFDAMPTVDHRSADEIIGTMSRDISTDGGRHIGRHRHDLP